MFVYLWGVSGRRRPFKRSIWRIENLCKVLPLHILQKQYTQERSYTYKPAIVTQSMACFVYVSGMTHCAATDTNRTFIWTQPCIVYTGRTFVKTVEYVIYLPFILQKHARNKPTGNILQIKIPS